MNVRLTIIIITTQIKRKNVRHREISENLIADVNRADIIVYFTLRYEMAGRNYTYISIHLLIDQ